MISKVNKEKEKQANITSNPIKVEVPKVVTVSKGGNVPKPPVFNIPVPSQPKPKPQPVEQPKPQVQAQPVPVNNPPPKTSGNPMDFRQQLMNRFAGKTDTSSSTNESSVNASLNLPQKDPNTGKVVIEIPEGSQRMDINKMIADANKAKAEQAKISNAPVAKVEVPKVVAATKGVPTPPVFSLPVAKPKPKVQQPPKVVKEPEPEPEQKEESNGGGQKMDFFSQLRNVQLKKSQK